MQVQTEGNKTVVDKSLSRHFLDKAGKLRNLILAAIAKKFLKDQHQLYFEFVNNVLLSRTEKRTIASMADLYLMEKLSTFEAINLPAIMMEHMTKVYNMAKGKLGLAYGYLLNHVFE